MTRAPLALIVACACAALLSASRSASEPGAAPVLRDSLPPGAARDSLPAAAAPDTAAAPPPLQLAPIQVIGAADGEQRRLDQPSGVATDAFGRIYVTDAARNCLVRYDAGGAWLGEAGALGSEVGDLRRPAGVAAVGSLGVVVLDRENRRLVLYDLFGRIVGVLVDLAALESSLGRVDPVAVSADRGGALYLAEADRDRVLALDFSGRYVRTLGGYGAGGGSFRGLAAVGVGPRGEVVTVERAGARVQRLDPGGNPLAAWTLPVRPGRGRMAVAVDDSTRVAVAEESGGRLWVFDSTGRVLATRQDLAGPTAVAFAPDGSLLVAEGVTGRVRRFALAPAGSAAPPGR